MATKVAWVPALLGLCVVGLNTWRAYTGPETADLSTAHTRAFRYLQEGRYDEAMRTVTAVEGIARANLNCRPGAALGVLMAKAQIYSLQMNTEDSERFLTQLEEECAGTPVAERVQVAACCERAFAHRLREDLPEAVRALERERELLELRECARRPDEVGSLDALFRRSYLYVQAPAQIGDLHRFLGRTDLALAEYRAALDYLQAHPEVVKPLHSYMKRVHNDSFCPCRYREVILPRAIRACEAAPDSPLGILDRCAACEAQQADYLLAVGSAYRHRHALDAALRHYDKAQRALEANRVAIDALGPEDQERYAGLKEQISKNMSACSAELGRLGDEGVTRSGSGGSEQSCM